MSEPIPPGYYFRDIDGTWIIVETDGRESKVHGPTPFDKIVPSARVDYERVLKANDDIRRRADQLFEDIRARFPQAACYLPPVPSSHTEEPPMFTHKARLVDLHVVYNVRGSTTLVFDHPDAAKDAARGRGEYDTDLPVDVERFVEFDDGRVFRLGQEVSHVHFDDTKSRARKATLAQNKVAASGLTAEDLALVGR